MKSYTEKLEKLKLANPTLRDCFDPFCHEYSESTMAEKIATLQKVVVNGFSLEQLTMEYCKLYIKLKKPYVAKDLYKGLIILINYLLQKHTSFKLKSFDNYSNEELINALTLLLVDTNLYPIEVQEIFQKHQVSFLEGND